jgi:hypothetical protein
MRISVTTATILSIFLATAFAQTRPSSPLPATIGLNGSNWKLGSFALGEGEAKQAFLPSFDDRAFRAATVPGEVQLQLGLKGMDLYYQSKELRLVNDKEWWYRLHFTAPREAVGRMCCKIRMCCKTQILAVVPTIAGSQMSRRPQGLALRSSGSRCLQHICLRRSLVSRT